MKLSEIRKSTLGRLYNNNNNNNYCPQRSAMKSLLLFIDTFVHELRLVQE